MSAPKKRGPGRPQLHAETKLIVIRVPVRVFDMLNGVISTTRCWSRTCACRSRSF